VIDWEPGEPMVRVPIKFCPISKLVDLARMVETVISDAFNSDTFPFVAFKTDTFPVDTFNTDTFALSVFMIEMFAVLMFISDAFVGPKVIYPVVVPIVIESGAIILFTVKVDEFMTDAFVVPSRVVDEFKDPTITFPVVKLEPMLIEPVVKLGATFSSLFSELIVFTVRVDEFNTETLVVPSILLLEFTFPTITEPVVKLDPTLIVPVVKLLPIVNSDVPASSALTVATEAFKILVLVIKEFTSDTFMIPAFKKDEFETDAFKNMV
jgi:hypothetical protein